MILSAVIPVTVSMSLVNAQPQPPIGLFGNPNDFRPGPPIPSCNCNADFNHPMKNYFS
jgi:hypothetical protein